MDNVKIVVELELYDPHNWERATQEYRKMRIDQVMKRLNDDVPGILSARYIEG